MPKIRPQRKKASPTFIRAWRQFRKMTLQQVADKVGLTAGAISQLERGDVSYTQGTLEALAGVYDCLPAELLMRDPKESEFIWVAWNTADPMVKRQLVEIAKTLIKSQGNT